MKKLISIAALSVLTACTAPQQASTIGNGAAMYDMNHTGYSRVPVAIIPSVGVGYCHHCW